MAKKFTLVALDEDVIAELEKRENKDFKTPNQIIRKLLKVGKNYCSSCRKNNCTCDADTQEAMDNKLQ